MDKSGGIKEDIKCLGTNSMYRNNCVYNTIADAIERSQGVHWMAGTWIFDWNNLAATPHFAFSPAFFFLVLPGTNVVLYLFRKRWGVLIFQLFVLCRWPHWPQHGLKTGCTLVVSCEVWPLCFVIPHGNDTFLKELQVLHPLLPTLFL